MRQYVGRQWQDNALGALGSFVPAAVNTGQYCVLTANNPPVVFGVTPQPYTQQFAFICTTFYGYANVGVTGGQIQPQVMCADGNFRDYGALITLSGSGFFISVTIPTPTLGAQFNLVSAITGGSVFLEIDILLG
jgi:hypothetical protein